MPAARLQLCLGWLHLSRIQKEGWRQHPQLQAIVFSQTRLCILDALEARAVSTQEIRPAETIKNTGYGVCSGVISLFSCLRLFEVLFRHACSPLTYMQTKHSCHVHKKKNKPLKKKKQFVL